MTRSAGQRGEQIGEPELARPSVFQDRFLRLQYSVGKRLFSWSANPVTSNVRRLELRPKLRLKPLKSYAHALCQMLIGWRMQDDLERFAQLPDGTFTVDALTGACTHSVVGELTTYIGPEIAAWFRHRLETDGIPIATITIATVMADVHTTIEQRRRDTRVTFDWKCRSRITSGARDFTSELEEPHTWCSGNSRTEKSGEPCDEPKSRSRRF